MPTAGSGRNSNVTHIRENNINNSSSPVVDTNKAVVVDIKQESSVVALHGSVGDAHALPDQTSVLQQLPNETGVSFEVINQPSDMNSAPGGVATSQVILASQAPGSQPQPGQTLIRRPISAAATTATPSTNQQGGQVVTKVIIQRQGQALGQGSQSLIAAPQGVQHHSPTQTITLSQGGIVSPQKIVAPSTPTKQILPAGKIPISPIKSPTTKYILSAGGQSPQKVTGSSGQMITMIARPQGQTASSVTTSTKPTTITMSPSKVMIKSQPQNQAAATAIQQAQKIMVSHSAGVAAPARPSSTGGVQPLSVAGSKFQYVRLVTTPTSQPHTGTKVIPGPGPSRPIVPAAAGAAPVKIAVPPQHSQQVVSRARTGSSGASGNSYQSGAYGASNQRLILPATSQPIPIQPQPAGLANMRSGAHGQQGQPQQPLAPLAPGTTINLQAVGGNMQSFALVPAQYVTQLQQQQQQGVVGGQEAVKQDASYVPINNLSQHGASTAAPKLTLNGPGSGEPATSRPRKPCNCTKSQCLKLYCDCFANGEFCNNCNCNNCFNNLEHEEERSRSIKACLERNPLAFHPKIGKSKVGAGDIRRHNKGCNCKRSGCLKNYCECYEAKILCSSLCKCVGCKNFEESPDRKTLMHLADAAEVRVQQQTAAKSKMEDLPARHAPPSTGERLAYTFVTAEVVEAACACLLAQAEETERTRQMDLLQERLILEEFGRCLMQIIESSNRTKAPSPV